MLEQEKELSKVSRPPMLAAVIGAVLLLAVGVGAYLWWQSRQSAPSGPVLTEEGTQYLPYLDLSNVEMKAEEDFLGQTLVTIEGDITNQGERTVTLIEVNCVFREPHGLEIAREPALIVDSKTGPLTPGDTKSFRLPFDNIPPEWNQMLPNLFISQIHFQ